MREVPDLKAVPDQDLLRRLSELLSERRGAVADLVAALAEPGARRLPPRNAADEP